MADDERAILKFRLAAHDMAQVAAASRLLLDGTPANPALRELVETGIIVTYWRPFSASNGVGAVSSKWVREAPRLHREMETRRNEIAAHTGLTELLEFDWSHDEETEHGTVYIRTPLDALLPELANVAEELKSVFTDEARRRWEQTQPQT